MEPPVAASSATHFGRGQWLKLLLLIGLLVSVLASVPVEVWGGFDALFLISLGGIALWRYAWWMTHFIRSRIYALGVFPGLRRRAEERWQAGWRPRFIHIMMVTFRERRETTERVLDSIARELEGSGIPARLFVGTGDASDERVIEEYFADRKLDARLEVVIVRQNQPGKRFAIGLLLRAISRHGVEKDDLAIFMDGDTKLPEGLVRGCAPLFELRPNLGAVTTDEEAQVAGPRWIQSWCDLRFAQRRLAMESHSLSRKVLTLTGRLSLFRAGLVVNEDFIRTVESDHLQHWLWGSFRFMSGDDKSTWYWLLKNRLDMLYVPDVRCVTIENIEGNPYARLKHNLLRWSGNMLRNGARAIALGPRRMGFFIWWCLIDQRLAMWTTITGPVAVLLLSCSLGPKALLAFVIWVLGSRLVLSSILWFYAGGINLAFPPLLYLNQIVCSVLKIYLSFRISKQRWLNRGDQRSPATAGRLKLHQTFMANFLTVFYVTLAVFAIALYTGIVRLRVWQIWWTGF